MTRKIQDYTGLKKHRLTFLERVGRNEQGNSRWKVRCECGEIFVVTATSVKFGKTYSCGCYRIENNKTRYSTKLEKENKKEL